jgi:2-dehydropantoate 2-reductase
VAEPGPRTGRLETAYLNGEIVLLGRLHGVPTPANGFLAGLAADLLRRGAAPGSMTVAEIEAAAAAPREGPAPGRR